ncbi:DUF6350 family protein [Bifidobacterium sp. ESL0790]|uniref:cell division protein PerM n=1 Tax=Bifidobacterium sp. ESL0790 TaxID=2983233 RepID=UPI0023FA31D1|nr:DUF6350 family protein [Bifidobacterium sp. ESL0790]WEV71712.1 DUF6350 family protein [Bifidobacterium sp. ESL0790]
MSKKGRPWLKGAEIAGLSLAIYTLLLWLFLLIVFFVVSMEEGGSGIMDATIPMTLSVVLLSQGVGFHAGSITLTITPLLLTILFVWLVAWLTKRFAQNFKSYVMAVLLWVAAMFLYSVNVTVVLADALPIVIGKTAIVFTIGYLLGALPGSKALKNAMGKVQSTISERVYKTLSLGIKNALWLLVAYLGVGLVTVLVWIIQNHAAMFKVFHLAGMQVGSRIVTTICTLAWLPNLCLWAVSWLFGAGFSIGDLASFTLWSDHASGLPAVPVFGLFPQSLSSDGARDILLSIPLLCGLCVGLVELFHPQGFALNAGKPGQRVKVGKLIVNLLYPLVTFVISSVLMSLVANLAFVFSSGALGRYRLRHVGVDAAAATQAAVKPTTIGLGAAWTVAVVLIAAIIGVRMLSKHQRNIAAASSSESKSEVAKTKTGTQGGAAPEEP